MTISDHYLVVIALRHDVPPNIMAFDLNESQPHECIDVSFIIVMILIVCFHIRM